MLYTGKGDDGTTGLFNCPQRFGKDSAVTEALGTVDEINSLLGVIKAKGDEALAKILDQAQQNLFIIQAELAGAKQTIAAEAVGELEKVIGEIEHSLPPITTFFVAGGTELGALLDYARTVARRAERRSIPCALQKFSRAYLNRLSSLLYALARLANHKAGIKEQAPRY